MRSCNSTNDIDAYSRPEITSNGLTYSWPERAVPFWVSSVTITTARGAIKGTGYFSSHSLAGRAGAMCVRDRTSPPFELASPVFQMVVADSDIHEQRSIGLLLAVRLIDPTTAARHPRDTDRLAVAFADSTTTTLALCSTTRRAPDSVKRNVTQ